MHAGFLWLTAAGNASKAGDAKNKIQSAVIGAILLFASYLILYIINPDLVKNTFNFSLPRSTTTTFPSGATKTVATPGSGALTGIPKSDGSGSFRILPKAQAQAGIYFFTIRAVDANGDIAEQDYAMEIFPGTEFVTNKTKEKLASRFYPNRSIARAAESELVISPPFIPDGAIGVPYFAEIIAAGGKPPYVYSVEEGESALLGIQEARAQGGLLPFGLGLQDTLGMPVLRISNLTAARNPDYFYYIGDRFRLGTSTIFPGAAVSFRGLKNNSPSVLGGVSAGSADGNGEVSAEGTVGGGDVGTWRVWAEVSGRISNVITIEVISGQNHSDWTGTAPAGQPAPICSLVYFCSFKTNPDDDSNDEMRVSGPDANCNSQVTNSYPAAVEISLISKTECISSGQGGGGSGGGEVSGCVGFGTGPGEVDFTSEFRSCQDEVNTEGITNSSDLPDCGTPEPGTPCGATGLNANGVRFKSVGCEYRDPNLARSCGAPGSGGFCLPGGIGCWQ